MQAMQRPLSAVSRQRNSASRARSHQTPEKRLVVRQVAQAIGDFGLIEDGDKVMNCASGGRNSYEACSTCCACATTNGSSS